MSHRDALDARDVQSLVAAIAQGVRVKYVFFWGHRPQQDGSISASCLSQWYASPFEIAGVHYLTAEHYMMATKARLFGDRDAEQRILQSSAPGAAKRIGREVRLFDERIWVEQRFEIAIAGTVAKFTQNPEIGAFLLGTSQRVLVEASPVDRIWGIGLEASDPRARVPALWPGLNVLGFALMEVRARIAAG